MSSRTIIDHVTKDLLPLAFDINLVITRLCIRHDLFNVRTRFLKKNKVNLAEDSHILFQIVSLTGRLYLKRHVTPTHYVTFQRTVISFIILY